MIDAMQESMLTALRARRFQIRARWEDLLRIEKVTTPLAHPDALVHLLDWTLEEFFQAVASLPSRRHPARAHPPSKCPCGQNPFVAFFAAGKQALRESLVLSQAENKDLSAFARDSELAELDQAFHQISQREIESFDAVCQPRR
jgi:hypothetical protein